MWSGQLPTQGGVAPSPLRQYESKPRTSPGMVTRLQTVESPGPAPPVRWQGPRKQKAFVDGWLHLWNTPTAAVHILFVSPSLKAGERGCSDVILQLRKGPFFSEREGSQWQCPQSVTAGQIPRKQAHRGACRQSLVWLHPGLLKSDHSLLLALLAGDLMFHAASFYAIWFHVDHRLKTPTLSTAVQRRTEETLNCSHDYFVRVWENIYILCWGPNG